MKGWETDNNNLTLVADNNQDKVKALASKRNKQSFLTENFFVVCPDDGLRHL